MIDALTQNTLRQKHQIKQEVERGGHVYTEIVQAQNVPLEIDEHSIVKTILKKVLNVFQWKYHLLVILYRDFKSHSVDDSHEGRLDWLIVA